MSTAEIWLLGLALGIDCFAVSLTTGITTRKFVKGRMTFMALCFGIFQGGMTLLGFCGINLFSDYLKPVDHWIAFLLLSYIGCQMIWDGFHDKKEKRINLLDYKTILTMSVATSIDALAVGISFACLDGIYDYTNIYFPVFIIGLCSLLLSILGLGLGISAGKKINWPVEIFGGIILIIIGIKILIEHLR